jgi:KEOPS complex subunit Pcc1
MNSDSGRDDNNEKNHMNDTDQSDTSAVSSNNNMSDTNSSPTANKTSDSVTHQRHTLELTWHYSDVQHAQIVSSAINQEVGEINDTRSHAQVETDDTTVTVSITATDLIALRAGANTWARFVAVAEQVRNSVDNTLSDAD